MKKLLSEFTVGESGKIVAVTGEGACGADSSIWG